MNKKASLKVSDIDTCRFRWDSKVRISNIIFAVIMLACLAYVGYSSLHDNEALLALLIMVVVLAFCLAMMPIGLIVDKDYIALKRLLGRKLIDKSDIVRIEQVDAEFMRSSRRAWGSSNALGYWGIFHHPEEGKIHLFCCNHDRLALIETSDKKYLINF